MTGTYKNVDGICSVKHIMSSVGESWAYNEEVRCKVSYDGKLGNGIYHVFSKRVLGI